jgi:hypothetical protein
MTRRSVVLICAACALMISLSDTAFAADGASTFESFYRPAFSISWVIAGLSAVVIGILVFVGLPVVGPGMVAVIGTIGTSIGGLFGLAGVAATNFGLAILGGGALVTGGFGMAGGTAVLAAALTFGTQVIFDYSAGTLLSKYESSKFSEASLTMMSLPLPVNTDGPKSVEAAGKALKGTLAADSWHCVKQFPESIDEFKQCIASKQKAQRELVRGAIAVMGTYKSTPETSLEGAERENAMSALLHFLANDYIGAKNAAQRAYALGIKSSDTPTLPAFIWAASMLYDDKPNFKDSFSRFQYAIAAEPKNPLTPVLFSAYLDRLSYRLNDRAATVAEIDRINAFSQALGDDERKLAIQQTLLAHYLMQIKVSQQRVISLTNTQNKGIRENPLTLEIVKVSFMEYDQMLNAGSSLIQRQNALLEVLASSSTWWKVLKAGKNPLGSSNQVYLDDAWSISLQNFGKALADYRNDKPGLAQRIALFEKELDDARKVQPPLDAPKQESWSLINWIKGIFK